ncbi:DUF1688-domain-containing protein [Pterulicium gracile]|uniref:DUF1688-domain-containing protein n=1 Tax=Pterulicium gracile TaxID=1884261 RepID=A0A5C3QTW6_9AGAR|nr:DUF1688-domain-containing protein [Pterula gracilis]
MSLLTTFTTDDQTAYLRTLPAIRERCSRVFKLAEQNKLEYFDYHPEKEKDVVEFCINIIKRDFGSNFTSIPPHGRWRHLDAGRARIEPLIAQWKSSEQSISETEICKRLLDLFLVSVLLDAGAGNVWKYTDKEGATFARSEGLGVASVEMFERGLFSGDATQPYRVDAEGLARVTVEQVGESMQAGPQNPMDGLEGRASLLRNLSKTLKEGTEFFGEDARPGNLIDFLQVQSKGSNPPTVPIAALWHALVYGLNSIWPPSRTSLNGVSLGDVWPCSALAKSNAESGQTGVDGADLVPFHKLTGWTAYSLIEPMEKILGWKFEGKEDMTGLPEYRNGGLLVDLGLVTLKPGAVPVQEATGLPKLIPSHPAIIEWRALTVIQLDRIATLIRKNLGLEPSQLNLAQVLESATWKGGREIAKKLRPATGGPPIEIESDGTVF